MASGDPEELLTVAEVAGQLKLNQQTIRNWIDRGELPAVRLGSRRVRIRRADLDALLAPGRTASGQAAEREAGPAASGPGAREELGSALDHARDALGRDA